MVSYSYCKTCTGNLYGGYLATSVTLRNPLTLFATIMRLSSVFPLFALIEIVLEELLEFVYLPNNGNKTPDLVPPDCPISKICLGENVPISIKSLYLVLSVVIKKVLVKVLFVIKFVSLSLVKNILLTKPNLP